MPTHREQIETNTTYFVTFTCYRWKHLIEEAHAYSAFYKWFAYMKSLEVKVLGYVIMPNHFHGLIHIPEDSPKTINQVLANGKRFIAYDIIKGLEAQKKEIILQELFHATTLKAKNSGKKHRVFKTSSDIKEIYSADMLITKLEYIHRNPNQGKWNLVDDYTTYLYSSAAFYELEKADDLLTDYRTIY